MDIKHNGQTRTQKFACSRFYTAKELGQHCCQIMRSIGVIYDEGRYVTNVEINNVSYPPETVLRDVMLGADDKVVVLIGNVAVRGDVNLINGSNRVFISDSSGSVTAIPHEQGAVVDIEVELEEQVQTKKPAKEKRERCEVELKQVQTKKPATTRTMITKNLVLNGGKICANDYSTITHVITQTAINNKGR